MIQPLGDLLLAFAKLQDPVQNLELVRRHNRPEICKAHATPVACRRSAALHEQVAVVLDDNGRPYRAAAHREAASMNRRAAGDEERAAAKDETSPVQASP